MSQQKPREFWIQEAAYCPLVFFDKQDFVNHETEMHELEDRPFLEATHVVEYSALEAAQAEIEKLKENNGILVMEVNALRITEKTQTHNLNWLNKEYVKLEEQAEKLVKALENSYDSDYHKAHEAVIAYEAFKKESK